MINYTDHLTTLMRDIIARVPTLSFIDMRDVLVFARFGRAGSDKVSAMRAVGLAIWVLFVVGGRVYAGAALQTAGRVKLRDAWRSAGQ